jgi:hypothetical protein
MIQKQHKMWPSKNYPDNEIIEVTVLCSSEMYYNQ